MATEVLMPKLGLTMTEGLVDEWYKNEGDAVKKGEALWSISSEKLSGDVEADDDGTLLKIVVAAGDSTAVKTPIAYVGAADETISAAATGPAGAEDVQRGDRVEGSRASGDSGDSGAGDANSPGEDDSEDGARRANRDTSGDGKRIFISKVAEKMAKKHGIDYSKVTGTGGHGRITKRDMKAYIESHPSGDADSQEPSDGAASAGASAAASASEAVAPVTAGEGLTGMRKIIAQNMMHSLHSTAQLTLHRKVNVTDLLATVSEIKGNLGPGDEAKALSMNVLLIKAVAIALQEHPSLNAHYDGHEYEQCDDVNIGVAVALDDGLAVPTVPNVVGQSLSQLKTVFHDRVDRARNGDIDTLAPGTFTITNLGTDGIEYFTPVLNVPEVAILGVGAQSTRLTLNSEGEIEKVVELPLSLTIDHQTVDGRTGAEFLSTLADVLAEPYRVLL
ncbi:2-oxo acid dehydrogenase subunit E2 [Corynebacterium sp. MC-21]|uniref:dihydrolipoamide acetyltransferase family protein n=1 Tax=Corynebacterium parakroppenstedtii TaxID=2828363 RepID=UPI001EF0B4DB|nr:dihydrolipoamide acetyltransferase family protein [Corynebacterium parakroppenstedtii]MCF6780021.1 2-oxo acid dehydrogenase subunit E2 [Corynebacterium parakroppenstedtii]MCF6790217.1 2-oxo acid dehydrogenase subunit E2 [Corynebacterium parakroppenstedtii]